jgi:hypothetical protein
VCAGCDAAAPRTSAGHLSAKGRDHVGVAGDGVVGEVSSHHAGQPLPLLGVGMMPASHEFLVVRPVRTLR